MANEVNAESVANVETVDGMTTDLAEINHHAETIAAETTDMDAIEGSMTAVATVQDPPAMAVATIKIRTVAAAPVHTADPAMTMKWTYLGGTAQMFPTCSLFCIKRWTATSCPGLNKHSIARA